MQPRVKDSEPANSPVQTVLININRDGPDIWANIRPGRTLNFTSGRIPDIRRQIFRSVSLKNGAGSYSDLKKDKKCKHFFMTFFF